MSHSLVLQKDTGDTIEVSCAGLREVFRSNRICTCEFLKIDAEGAEYEILRAAPTEVFDSTSRIVVEVHRVPGWSPTDLCELLMERGFETAIDGSMVFARRRM
jgi:hypothetical protein